MSNAAVGWSLKLDLRGDHTMKLVLVAFSDSADGKTGEAWPGDPYVAEVAECSTRTVQRKRETLERLGLLTLKQKHWRGQTHLYGVNVGAAPDWAKLEEKGSAEGATGHGVQGETQPDSTPQVDSDPTATGHAPDTAVSERPDTQVSERPDTQVSDEPERTGKNLDPGTGTSAELAEPASAPPVPLSEPELPLRWEGHGTVVVEIPLAQTSDPAFRVRTSLVADYAKDFPALDIVAELRAVRRWNEENPKKRKTRDGIRRHITTWLTTAQNEPRKRARADTGGRDGRGGMDTVGAARQCAEGHPLKQMRWGKNYSAWVCEICEPGRFAQLQAKAQGVA